MTRARNRTHGLANPALIPLSLEAVLCVFVSLVHRAAATLGMIFKRHHRDWHTENAREDLPQEKTCPKRRPAFNSTRPHTPPTESCSALSRDPLLAHRGDATSLPSKPTTKILGSRPSMTPLVSLDPDEPSRCHSGRTRSVRAGTQEQRARAPPRAAPGFPLARVRVGNDTVGVATKARQQPRAQPTPTPAPTPQG